jgi:hypothetical protein
MSSIDDDGPSDVAPDDFGRMRGVDQTETMRPKDLDVTLAILGGPRRWLSEAWPQTQAVNVMWGVSTLGLAFICALVTVGWSNAIASPNGGVGIRMLAAWIVAILLMLLPASATRFPATALPAGAEALLRGVLLASLVSLAVPLAGVIRYCLIAAFALFMGSDAAMTFSLVGVRRRSTKGRLASLVLAPLHGGLLLGGLLALTVLRQLSVGTIAQTIVHIDMLLILTYSVWLAHHRYSERLDQQRYDSERQVKEDEHRKRSHWIHDDVLAELNLGRLSLERGDLSAEGLIELLAGIDHRLRIRQLDEVLQSGSATIAEIIQPFVRLSVASGLTNISVPASDLGAISVTNQVGEQIKRALAVTTANALLAHATQLTIDVRQEHEEFVVTIDDDAGGFERSVLHAGRGLDVLDRELNPGNVKVEKYGPGTRVTCRIRCDRTGMSAQSLK